MIVVKRTDVCGFRHWICGEHLILLVNDVFKPGFGDTLIRFEVFSTFDRWNLHFGGFRCFPSCQHRVFACFHPNLLRRFGIRLVLSF